MLGLGWTEMLVIGVVALIVIGPKDLPMVMARIGKFAGQIRRMGTEFQREINKTTGLDEVRNLRNSITAPLKKSAEEIRKEFNAMTPTGVQPSGVIKPANPKAESVVDEIKAAAGIAPDKVEPAKLAAAAPASLAAPVKAAASPTRPVATTDLKPIEAEEAKPAPAKRVRKTPAKAATTGTATNAAPKARTSRAKAAPATAESAAKPKPAPRKRATKSTTAKASAPATSEPKTDDA